MSDLIKYQNIIDSECEILEHETVTISYMQWDDSTIDRRLLIVELRSDDVTESIPVTTSLLSSNPQLIIESLRDNLEAVNYG